MRFYTFLVVLALALSLALSAPIQYRYGNILVELKHRAYLITGFPLGLLGRILMSTRMSFVVAAVSPFPMMVYSLSDPPKTMHALSVPPQLTLEFLTRPTTIIHQLSKPAKPMPELTPNVLGFLARPAAQKKHSLSLALPQVVLHVTLLLSELELGAVPRKLPRAMDPGSQN